jgi:predicted membrane protein
MDLLFDLAWKRKTEYYKNSHYFGFILFVIGAFLIFERPSFFGFAVLIFSLGILIPYFYYYFKIKSLYRKLETEKALEIEASKNLNLVFWEFTETCLIMESEGKQRKLNWEDFVAQLVKEDNLFMFTTENEPLALGEVEVGKENFKMIVDFVGAKICH